MNAQSVTLAMHCFRYDSFGPKNYKSSALFVPPQNWNHDCREFKFHRIENLKWFLMTSRYPCTISISNIKWHINGVAIETFIRTNRQVCCKEMIKCTSSIQGKHCSHGFALNNFWLLLLLRNTTWSSHMRYIMSSNFHVEWLSSDEMVSSER